MINISSHLIIFEKVLNFVAETAKTKISKRKWKSEIKYPLVMASAMIGDVSMAKANATEKK